ncbi:hypothetical protein [Halorussus caseinilyticus]|uniref:Uncharacterized protein n=1 Tax=Halorussus caseinilyticus TaxID=3034025 RepID=A0ABD5WMA2_9EURY
MEWVAVLLIDQSVVAQLVKGLGSVAFAAYGLVFADKLESLARGTSLDTLRRHLLPVLVSLGDSAWRTSASSRGRVRSSSKPSRASSSSSSPGSSPPRPSDSSRTSRDCRLDSPESPRPGLSSTDSTLELVGNH